MKTRILITGATGTTSQYVIDELLKKEYPVRAMVRTLDERSQALEEKGVEIVKGDFGDLKSLRVALKDMDRAYFLYPFIDHLPKAAGYFAKIARENGVQQVVNMSQMNAHENTSSPASQNHFIADEIMDWAEVNAVTIKPALFAWNYLNFAGPTAVREGKFYFPDFNSRFSIVHPKDVADVVVSLLTDPDPDKHSGKKYSIAGDQTYSNEEVASEFGALLNKEVSFTPIPVDHWIEAIKDDPYVSEYLAVHLRELIKDIDAGQFDDRSTTVLDLTGHEPRTFKEYLEEHEEYVLRFKN